MLVAAVGCALVLATGCGRSPAAGPRYTLLQMNLCLSGLAVCRGRAAHPAAVGEAAARIREIRPDAVTINEACSGDARALARRAGYHVRFSSVFYLGEPLRCIDPVGRGIFGDAVLTRAAVDGADSHAFAAQEGPERRGWLCVGTRVRVDVCTAHLNTRATFEAAANDEQCGELAALLARRAAVRAVVFGGDLNRTATCAPAGFWTRTDTAAAQAPGLQHVYGSGAPRSPSAEVVPAAHTDHDFLLVAQSSAR